MKRCLSGFLVLVLVTSLCAVVPVSAASESGKELPVVGVLYDSDFLTGWNGYFSKLQSMPAFGGIASDYFGECAWSALDAAVSAVGYGGFSSYSDLARAANSLNVYFNGSTGDIPSVFALCYPDRTILRTFLVGAVGLLNFAVVEHPDYGFVIQETHSSAVVCNRAGAFPYYKTVVDTSAPDSDLTETLGGKWVREDQISTPILYNIVNEATLYDMGQALKDTGKTANQNKIVQFNGSYQVIMSTIDDHGFQFVYCDSKGRPYVVIAVWKKWSE